LIRAFDILLSVVGLIVGLPLFVVLLIVGWFDTGSPIFRQERVGRYRRSFVLVKFRTMKPGTASRATHLTSASAITPFGRFLRHSKLDELPQLWNVLKGEMSLVGPRPCLPSQEELIDAREARGVFVLRPGVTGLAQVQGVDMSDPERLAELDQHMVEGLTLRAYFRYLFLTATGKGAGDRVRPSS